MIDVLFTNVEQSDMPMIRQDLASVGIFQKENTTDLNKSLGNLQGDVVLAVYLYMAPKILLCSVNDFHVEEETPKQSISLYPSRLRSQRLHKGLPKFAYYKTSSVFFLDSLSVVWPAGLQESPELPL